MSEKLKDVLDSATWDNTKASAAIRNEINTQFDAWFAGEHKHQAKLPEMNEIVLSEPVIREILEHVSRILESFTRFYRSAITKIEWTGSVIRHSSFRLTVEFDFAAYVIDYTMETISNDPSWSKDERSAAVSKLKTNTVTQLTDLLHELAQES